MKRIWMYVIIGTILSGFAIWVMAHETKRPRVKGEYPTTIESLPLQQQVEFIQFVGNAGWYAHYIIGADEIGPKILDGTGHIFQVPWKGFYNHTRKDHKWTNKQIKEFFDENNITPTEPYPASIQKLPIKKQIEFAEHSLKWFNHFIDGVNGKAKTVTLRDGLGNSFTVGFDFFFTHTWAAHNWTNKLVQDWRHAKAMKKLMKSSQ